MRAHSLVIDLYGGPYELNVSVGFFVDALDDPMEYMSLLVLDLVQWGLMSSSILPRSEELAPVECAPGGVTFI